MATTRVNKTCHWPAIWVVTTANLSVCHWPAVLEDRPGNTQAIDNRHTQPNVLANEKARGVGGKPCVNLTYLFRLDA